VIAPIITAGVFLLVFILSVIFVYEGVREVLLGKSLLQGSTTRSTLLTDGEQAKVTGTVEEHPEFGTQPAPFTDEQCVYGEWKATRRQYGQYQDHWKTLSDGVVSFPFLVNDGNSVVEIDPDEVDEFLLSQSDNAAVRIPSGDGATEKARNQSSVEVDWTGSDVEHRLHQDLLQHGDDIKVVGTAHRTTARESPGSFSIGPSPTAKDEGDCSSETLLVTDWNPRRIKAQFVIGPLKSLLGVLGMIAVAGMAVNTFYMDFYFNIFAGLSIALIAAVLVFSYAESIYLWRTSQVVD